MSGDNDDVVELEANLSNALDGGDEALAKMLRETTGGDTPLNDDDTDDAGAADADGNKGGGDSKGAAAGAEAGSKAAEADPAGAAAAAGEQGGKPGEQATGQESQTGEEQQLPIASKSGNGTIPYSVLSDTRRRAATLETELATTKQQLTEALAKASGVAVAGGDSSGAAKTTITGDAGDVQLTDEELEDMPEPVRKLYQKVQRQEQVIADLNSKTTHHEVVTQQSEAEKTQSLIDQVPDLAQWQSKGGTLWTAARGVDRELLADPQWAAKDPLTRYAEVVRRVREDVGLPATTTQQQTTTTAGSGTQQAAGKKSAAAAVPASISDIPGGGAPNLDLHDSIERTSAPGLGARMAEMKDSDIDALLSKL